MEIPTDITERALFREGYQSIIGVDEVGMGCLAGPVVVCAVRFHRILPKIQGIRDSKLLSSGQRDACVRALQHHRIPFVISYCYPKTIDRINIYQAARKAMRRAVRKLNGDIILVDGPHPITGLNLPQRAIIKGDRTVFAIAAASILAKWHRDRMMTRYAKRFPEYGFEKHKGYGTKLHYAALTAHGPCELHRKSFTLSI